METKESVADLIRRGGVLFDVEGKTTSEIYRNICDAVTLPAEVSKDEVYNALCDRERIMSTAVGHGIALPHSRGTILKNEENQQITVCYLKEPIDMNAPDARHVYVMFVLLTSNAQTHLQMLSQLATLFKDEKFKQLLENHSGLEELINAIQNLI